MAGASADSFLWFRLARGVAEGWLEAGAHDALRRFPDGVRVERVPALPRLLAALSGATGLDVYSAGAELTTLLASLFVVPLCLYAWRAGALAAGVGAGLLGSFAPAYYARTSPTFVDTDGGNMLFVWLFPALVAGIAPGRGRRNALLAAAAGACLAGFCWWYHQLGFWWIYALTFVASLAAAGLGARRTAALALVFGLCAGPLYAGVGAVQLVGVLRDVLLPATLSGASAPGPLSFASIVADIEELGRVSPRQVLEGTLRWAELAALGLLGLAAFAASRPRPSVPLLPILALALLSFGTSQRFAMYLGPLVGLGLGFWLHMALTGLLPTRPLLAEAASTGLAFAMVGLLLPLGDFRRPSPPSVSPAMAASLVRLRGALPDGALVAQPWGYGYAIADLSGAATLNDGEWPDPVIEYLVARAFTTDDPAELRALLGWLASHPRDVTRELFLADPEAALARVRREGRVPERPPVVVLFAERNLYELPTHFARGQWSFRTRTAPEEHIDSQSCVARSPTLLACGPEPGRVTVDLASGEAASRPFLRRALRIGNGRVLAEAQLPHAEGYTAQLLEPPVDGVYTLQLLREPAYRSALNQIFQLGRYDAEHFEEILRDPPLRAFRLRPDAGP